MAILGRAETTAVCFLAIIAVPTVASAQPAPPRGDVVDPSLEPPHAIEISQVPYPAEGKGSASVVLELRVDKTGAVREVRVIEGEDPFAAAAVDAAPSWKFSPGRKDGQAVEARVRLRIDFTPPTLPSP